MLRGRRTALLLLVRQLLLALGQFLQLLQRFVHFSLLRVGRLVRLHAFVLVLLRVQLEIEEPFEIARGAVHSTASASAASALAAHGHLDVAERGFGAQQELQRLLLWRQRILPLGGLQLVDGRLHGRCGLFHIRYEALKRIARFVQLAALHALRQRRRLVLQLRLNAGKERRILLLRAAGALPPGLIPRGGDDLLLPLRNLVLLVGIAAAPSAAAATVLLRLRVVALERLRLYEEHVGLRLRPRVVRRGVNAHHIARHYFEILQRDDRSSGGSLGILGLQQRNRLLGPAVHRVVQLHIFQTEIVLGIHGDGDFLNRAGAEIAPWTRDAHVRRVVLNGLDEVVFAQAHVFAAFERGNVVHAILLDENLGSERRVRACRIRACRIHACRIHACRIHACRIHAFGKGNLRAVVEHQLASGRSVMTVTSATVPCTARRSPPGSSVTSFNPSHAG